VVADDLDNRICGDGPLSSRKDPDIRAALRTLPRYLIGIHPQQIAEPHAYHPSRDHRPSPSRDQLRPEIEHFLASSQESALVYVMSAKWLITILSPPDEDGGGQHLVFNAQTEDQKEVQALATEARNHNQRLQIWIRDPFGELSSWVPDWRERLVCSKCGSREIDMVVTGERR
jgi:hypothetical protein